MVSVGQAPLVTSTVRSVHIRIRFIPVFFSELQYAHRLMHAHESIGLLILTHSGCAIVSDDVGVVVELLVSEAFGTRHISLIHFSSGTLRCHIPRFTCVVSRDTSSFRILCASVWVPSLRRTSSHSFILSLIYFVIHCRPAIPAAFSPMRFLAAFNGVVLMHTYISSTFIFLVWHS